MGMKKGGTHGAVVNGSICQMVDRREGGRWRERRRTRVAHTWHENNHLMGTRDPSYNTRLATSPSFSPLAVWKEKPTTATAPRSQTQTQTPNTAPLACCAAHSPHRFSSHLYFHLVWASCYWVLPLAQGWSWVCVCVRERSIDLSTAKRIKESEQACPSFCHVINIVSMSLFAALVTLSLYDARHVSAVTKTPWTDSSIGTKLINNQAKNAQHWQVSAF